MLLEILFTLFFIASLFFIIPFILMMGEFKQTSSKFHEILKAEIFRNRSCFRVPRLSEIPHVGIKFDINLKLRLVL
jgi:hypothetical protein